MGKEKILGEFKKLFLIAEFTGLNFFLSGSASADLENPIDTDSFAQLIEEIAEIVAEIGVPIAVIAIIWAGFLFVTAQGNEDKIKTAKKTFFWAIIGTAVLLGAWVLASAIEEFVLQL